MENHEIAILLLMYDLQIIGDRGYTSFHRVRTKTKWQKIASIYRTRESFKTVTRRLANKGYLSDKGKSMAVLSLTKIGVDYVVGYLELYPNAMRELEAKLND